ncbi:MAG: hypothetical protein E2O52_08950 [Gammaproteobacteria bacterium]|nr:MAG: hypothetical protein E2O52_08950 [Gammaproteobacteria bacterium]
MIQYAIDETVKIFCKGIGNLLRVVLLFVCALPVLAENVFTDVSRADANMTTGPEVGERIPMFSAIDQHGVRRSFEDIRGPNGAMILFHRSADW